MVPDPYDTQDYTRYAYVKNNPVKYIDPTGHYDEGGDSGFRFYEHTPTSYGDYGDYGADYYPSSDFVGPLYPDGSMSADSFYYDNESGAYYVNHGDGGVNVGYDYNSVLPDGSSYSASGRAHFNSEGKITSFYATEKFENMSGNQTLSDREAPNFLSKFNIALPDQPITLSGSENNDKLNSLKNIYATGKGADRYNQASSGGGSDVSKLNVSDKGVAFIADYEKFSSKVYICSGGKKTIGYGHVLKEGEDFSKGIDKSTALALLKNDIQIAVSDVQTVLKGTTMTQWEFDATVALVVNVGRTKFDNYSVSDKIASGQSDAIVETAWRSIKKAGGDDNLGIMRRRYDEAQMYFNNIYARTYHTKEYLYNN